MIDFPDKQPICSHTHILRSRYAETDQMGYVYYGRYPEFFEVARTEMMRSLGLAYKTLEENGVMLPVISMEIEYKMPVLYDEEMNVEAMLFDEPVFKLHTFYRITTGRNSAPHVTGRVTLCFVDSQSRRPVKAPAILLNKLRK
jgi:acyl-CoA thioester hydrolase